MSIKYYLILVLMCLVISDVQHLFMYLLATYVPSFETSMYFPQVSTGLLSYTY